MLASWTSDIWRRSFLMQDLLPESRRQTSFLNVVVPLTLHLPDPLRLSATAKCSWVLRNVQSLGHWGLPEVYTALYLAEVAARSSSVGTTGQVDATRGGSGGSWAADICTPSVLSENPDISFACSRAATRHRNCSGGPLGVAAGRLRVMSEACAKAWALKSPSAARTGR